MITLDTSGILALLDSKDPEHTAVVDALDADAGPYLVPAETLGEVGYFVESQFGTGVLDAFLADLAGGQFTLDCAVERLPRVRSLVTRYGDLPLGLVDSAVIACAEANGGRVLTLDRRHFGVVAKEGFVRLLP